MCAVNTWMENTSCCAVVGSIEEEATRHSVRGVSVLIVEDDVFLLRSVLRSLNGSGIQGLSVAPVSSIADAAMILHGLDETSGFDIAILNLRIDGETSLRLAEDIRKKFPLTQIAFWTGPLSSEDASIIDQAIKATVVDLRFTKSMHPLHIIKRLMQRGTFGKAVN